MLFITKLYARSNVFKLIKKKHGQDVFTAVRNYEKVKTKLMKVDQDIKFIKSCEKEHLVPTFAKFNLSIKSGSYKLKCKISKLMMQTELENKHQEKRKLRKEIRSSRIKLKSTLGLILALTEVRYLPPSKEIIYFTNKTQATCQ